MRTIIMFLIILISCNSNRPKNCSNNSCITDIDGNVYHIVKIGAQVWMLENLKVTHYRNGDSIPNITNYEQWNNLFLTGAYCNYYDNSAGANNALNVNIYGRLYNWYAVNDPRGIAPKGWHVPTDAEWQTMIDYLGGSSIAGGKMKETGTTHWNSPNIKASNESGFKGLPGGYRDYGGDFSDIGNCGNWWASTQHDVMLAWFCTLEYDRVVICQSYGYKSRGFSIRCVKD